MLLINSLKIQSKLIGVVELIRHGARTPSTFMDASAKLYFGARRAQLTVNGFRQHVLLGRWLRRRYVHGDIEKLFSKEFDPKEIKMYSSPRQRTIFSATAHLMGIFPKSVVKVIFESKNFRNNDKPPLKNFKLRKIDGKEVNVHVFSYRNDYIFHSLKCHRRGSIHPLKNEIKKNSIFKISKEEFAEATLDILDKYKFLFTNRHSFQTVEEYNEFQKNYKKKRI